MENTLNIYTEKFGYMSDIKVIHEPEFRKMNLRYMFSIEEKGIDWNIYEDKFSTQVYAINSDEI